MENKQQSAFLLKLQQALKEGKANESTKHINTIDEQSKALTADDAQDRITSRLEQAGYVKGVTKEEMLKTQAAYESEMEAIKKEEAKFTHIASIENTKSQISAMKIELAEVIVEIEKKYAISIAQEEANLKESQENFKKKYGEEEYKKSFENEDTTTA